jgi:hypothetical protein
MELVFYNPYEDNIAVFIPDEIIDLLVEEDGGLQLSGPVPGTLDKGPKFLHRRCSLLSMALIDKWEYIGEF